MRVQQIPVDDIIIGTRHRKDMGDLKALAASIEAEGLLQPIGITHDKELVFGQRRLAAVKDILGWDRIPAASVAVSSILNGEYAENEIRKDFTISERVAIGRAIEQQIPERRGRPIGEEESTAANDIVENFPQLDAGVKSRDIVAKVAGFGNPRTYEQSAKVVDHGTPELVAAMDHGVAPSLAARVAELPKAEQKKAVKAFEAGDKKALKKAVAPPVVKLPHAYPVSDAFWNWLSSLAGMRTKIKQEHGSIGEMFAHKGWDKSRTSKTVDLLGRVRDGIDELYKEAQKHA